MRLRTIAVTGVATLPGASFAMGGEAIFAEILTDLVVLFIWAIATIISLFIKRKRYGIAWFLVWAVRLSLPIMILWVIFEGTVLDKMNQERLARARSKQRAEFELACKALGTGVTRILHVENTERPKAIYVEEPDEPYGPNIRRRLVDCTEFRTPVCRELGLETVEWEQKQMWGVGPCKPGSGATRRSKCAPEFMRTEFGADRPKHTRIEKPASQYVIRVEHSEPEFGPDKVNRYRVNLVSLRTTQVLATTELLVSRVALPCQDFESEVASMLTRSFPAP